MDRFRLFLAAGMAAICLNGCTDAAPVKTAPASVVTVAPTVPATTATTTLETIPGETTMPVAPVMELTREEQELLLKLGMAERGETECSQCIALVMCTVLNRVRSERFGSSVSAVIYAKDQFTPVGDGTFSAAVPNEACYEALEMVIYGWDESQGALYYEFCDGPSWHSRNLQLLTEHCNTRFYIG